VLRALSREGDGATEVLQGLMEDTAGLPGASDTAAFVIGTLLRPDSERVARQAVESLAMLAAAAALNMIHPAHAELFAATRLSGVRGALFGAAELSVAQCRGLLDRALPA
jgi:putative acyl-CoA dehydrogenase